MLIFSPAKCFFINIGAHRFMRIQSFLHKLWLLAVFSSCFSPHIPAYTAESSSNTPYLRLRQPDFLTFDELKELGKDPTPEGPLGEKLETFWNTPVISNEAYYRGARPRNLESLELGPYIRTATWNIEKSLNMEDAIKIFSSEEKFHLLLNPLKAGNPSQAAHLTNQRKKLATADIILLQEMDLGVKRSGYIDASRDLAEALNMNYVFAAEQLEIDPVTLGLESINFEEGDQDSEATEFYKADPARYKGAFGCAVLSKYPIRSAEAFQLKSQPYDWYHSEKLKPSYLEHARRRGTKLLFLNEITREVKAGGRIYFRVDLAVPELPGGTLTIINVHLEIKCLPQGREEQMRELLSYIRDIRNPVILAGDFNSAPTDISATSVKRVVTRTAKNPTTWLSAGISLITPHAFAINTSRGVSNITKNLQDPTARHISIVAPNHVRPMFDLIRDFRFSDGSAFDFRGDKKRSSGRKNGTLANSNQRDFKGFVTTFELRRPLVGIVGKYKLDWFFVKSNLLKSPDPRNASYKLAPHFAETLEDLNTSLRNQISDHHPMVMDIPLGEPSLED